MISWFESKVSPDKTKKKNWKQKEAKQHHHVKRKIKKNQIPNTSTITMKMNICLATAF